MKSLIRNVRLLAVTGVLFASLPMVGFSQSTAPSVETLEKLAKEAHEKFKDDKNGKNADYIRPSPKCQAIYLASRLSLWMEK